MAGIFKTFRGDEIQLTPYNAHKDYIVYIENYTGSYYEPYYEQSVTFNNPITSSADLVEREVSMSVFAYDATYQKGNFYPDEFGKYQSVLSSSGMAKTTNGYFQRAMHSSLQGMYYTKPDDPCYTLDNSGYEKEYRELGKKAQILSIPQRMHGEAIRKGSVLIRSGSILASRITLRDDGFGNLYDENVTGSISSGSLTVSQSISFVSASLISLNFADLYNQEGQEVTVHSNNDKSQWKQKYGGNDYNISNDFRFFERSVYANNVALNRGTVAHSDDEGAYIVFDGDEQDTMDARNDELSSSYMEIEHRPWLDLRRNEDYTVALRISCSAYQPVSHSGLYNYNHAYILHKQDYTSAGGFAYPYSLRQVLSQSTSHPNLTYGVPGTLQAQMRVGSTFIKLNTTGSVTSSLNKFWDVAIVKENTTMSLYLDGEIQDSASLPDVGELHNFAPITLGANRVWGGYYAQSNPGVPGATQQYPLMETRANWKGGISNLAIFNRALTPPEISYAVATSGRLSNIVGNVFYNHGIITLTSEKAKYRAGSQGPMFSHCTLSFENTHNIMEHQYTCNIKEREYMYTMNPTIMDDNKLGTIKHYVTRSEWSPYVTTIGLYDEYARLLAVGKLSRPIKKSED
jgi:hypothetical protein